MQSQEPTGDNSIKIAHQINMGAGSTYIENQNIHHSNHPINRFLTSAGVSVSSDFLGREDDLLKIRQTLMENPQPLVLVNGEGGIGKTSIAAKYWQIYGKDYKYLAWLYCESGIVNAMSSLVYSLKIEDRFKQVPEQLQLEFLKNELAGLERECLLILDNANEKAHIEEFLQVFNGLGWHVLITSRCQKVAKNEIYIDHLPQPLAKQLFEKYYQETNPTFENFLNRFLKAIGFNTLCIEVFAKNLREMAALGETMESFLAKLEQKGFFLGNDSFEIQTDYTQNIRKQAATTDQILYVLYDLNHLEPLEDLMLTCVALLPAETHTIDLLFDVFQSPNKHLTKKVLDNLVRKGWLFANVNTYRISPIVQSIVLTKNHNKLPFAGEPLIQNIAHRLAVNQEEGDILNKFKWLPFGKRLLSIFSAFRPNNDYSNLQSNQATVLRYLGGTTNLLEAKGLLTDSLAFTDSYFGKVSIDSARNQSDLALVLHDLGGEENLKEAKFLLRKAIEIASAHQEPNAIALYKSNLASALGESKEKTDIEEACELLKQVLDFAISTLDIKSPIIAIRKSKLAILLRRLGDGENLGKAEKLIREALASDESNFGANHYLVAVRKSILGSILKDIGCPENLIEAKRFFEEALDSDMSNFGLGSLIVAKRQINLALLLLEFDNIDTEKLKSAKELLKSAQVINTTQLGDSHPDTLVAREKLMELFVINIAIRHNLKEQEDIKEYIPYFWDWLNEP